MSEEDSLSMDINEKELSDESDSSSEDDDIEERKHLERARELENAISDNKYSYDVHVELVNIYRQLGDLNSMRAAYKRFQECFPLTPTLWLNWLKDEIKVANTLAEQKKILKLFDLAVEDYLSVDLWMEYAQYSIGVNDLDTTRGILERGLMSAGLHCPQGSLLWDTLRELEHAHIALHEEGSEEWSKQIKRVSDVFKRQLSVPLLNMETTLQEWSDWVETIPNETRETIDKTQIEYGYNKAVKVLESYKPFEERLLTTESENNNDKLLEIYREYIQLVKDHPSAVICLYERAASQLCLVSDIWIEYVQFLMKLGDNQAAFTLCKRALRNCTWNSDLWTIGIRLMEKNGVEESEVLQYFEEGISAIPAYDTLDLWLAYIEFLHRNCKSNDKFDKTCHQAIAQSSYNNDPTCKVNRLFARILAKRGDMKAARKVWSGILAHGQNKATASVWLEYGVLEQHYGDPNYLRNLYQKALHSCKDWPQSIAEDWLLYERQFGTLDDVLKCVDKCKTVLVKTNDYNNAATTTYKHEKETNTKDQQRKTFKRKHEHEDTKESSKTRKLVTKHTEENVDINKPQMIDKNPKTTVFISNLHPNVDESLLQGKFPDAVNINVVRDRKGKSKCFAYVQFGREEQCLVALARDREPIDGRPMYVSELKTDKNEPTSKSVFKYAMNEERNKLFVRGLPVQKSKEDVAEIFKKYGAVDVRLVLHKSGQPKGLAYVEFESADAAQKAMKATDQMDVDGHTIGVAISAPPPKKSKPQSSGFGKSYTDFDEPHRHARSRLQVPLIPRTVQLKTSSDKKGESSSSTSSNGGNSVAPKSNADFRNMLLRN